LLEPVSLKLCPRTQVRPIPPQTTLSDHSADADGLSLGLDHGQGAPMYFAANWSMIFRAAIGEDSSEVRSPSGSTRATSKARAKPVSRASRVMSR
jgi:hypothetical protein